MKTRRRKIRPGFTIIELLIVMGLIAIMATVVVTAIQGVTGTSRTAATKSLIVKVSRMLEDRVESFYRFVDKQDRNAGDRLPRYVELRHLQQAAGRRELAKILARKDLFRRHFPQIFSEDDDSPAIPNWPQNNPNFIPAAHDPLTTSAECLYYFLTSGETFGAEPIGVDAFTSAEVQDTDGDGLLEFVDAWGQPLRFYRWPTRLLRPNDESVVPIDTLQFIVNDGNTIAPNLNKEYQFKITTAVSAVLFGPLPPVPPAQPPVQRPGLFGDELQDPLARDGDDPLGLIHQWANTGTLNSFPPPNDQLMSPSEFERRYHTPDTYHIPLILSVGSDGTSGLYEPHSGVFIPGLAVGNRVYNDTNFGRLAQPINTEDTNSNGVLDPGEDTNNNGRLDTPQELIEARYDNICNIFLRAGATR